MRKSRLGMVADNKRNIASGAEFNALIPQPEYKKELLKKGSENISDTMKFMGQILSKFYKDTVKLAPLLEGSSKYETCRNIWNFVYNHIQYSTESEEQLPRPSYTWHVKRRSGADCDDYAIFISSILLNLGINHKVRITKYNGNADFQHVYIVVPNQGKDIIVDPVLDYFDKEETYSFKKDYTMSELGVNIWGLKGIEPTIQNPIVHIGQGLFFGSPSLGDTNEDDDKYKMMVASRDMLLEMPSIMPGAEQYIKMYQLIIDAWYTPNRADAIAALASYEDGLSGNSGLGKTFFGKLIAGAVDLIKKINPVSIVIRNAFLLALKLNLFNIAKKLAPGYYTYEEISTKVSKDTWEKSVKSVSEVESMYKNFGGTPKFVRAAVLTKNRKLAGLGVLPAAAAIAASAPLLIKVVEILKKFGLSDGDIQNLGDSLAKGGQQLLDSITSHTEKDDGTPDVTEDGLPASTTPANTAATTVETQAQILAEQNAQKSSMNMFLIIGLAGAALFALMASKSKGSKGSPHPRLNGVPRKRGTKQIKKAKFLKIK